MRCNRAGKVMMAYIDRPLSIRRHTAKRMFSHLNSCGMCQTEFNVYDELINGFAPIEADCAANNPAFCGFEANVLSAIKAAETKWRANFEGVVTAALCALSLIVGVMTVVLLAITPEGVSNLSAGANEALDALWAVLTALLSQYRMILAVAFGAAVFVFSRVCTRQKSQEASPVTHE